MSDVIQLDGIAFIPLDVAAHEADLSSDYLYRLSRNGTIASRIIGRRRYVEKQSLQAFLIDRAHRLEGQRVELAKQRAEEYARRSGAVPSEGIRTSAQSAETRAAFPGRSGVSGDALRETTQGVAAAALEVTKRAIESTRVVASGTSKKGSVVSNVLNQHGAKLVEGMRESMSVSGMGDAALRAGISGVHVPLYSVTPMMEFVHKLIALTLAFMLTFGTYSLVDPQYAKFALTSIESNVHAVHMSYVSFTHGGVTKLASSADAQLAAAAENPAQTLALATYTITNAVPQSLATLAKSINSSVNGFVYAIAFPDALVRSPVTGTVDVHVTTYQHTTVASTGSNAGAGVGGGIGTSTGTSTANSVGVGQGGPVTVIQNPVIERIIETAAPSMVAAAGGITEDELNARLQQLDNKLSSQIFAITAQGSANTTAISSNYQSIATTQRIDQLASVDISSSHWSGGTIDGADISNVTSLSVSGNTALATTTVTGDLTLSGSLRFTTSSSTISATTASTTNLLFTNATGTYAVLQDATTTGHAIFSGEARISDAAATSTGNLYFGNNTAHINYNSSDYTVYGGSFYTNAGRIVSIGNNETIGLGVRNVNGDGTYYLGASHSFTPDLIFTNTGLTETARLTNGGFFGIGTTTPWAQLSLSSASGSPAFAIGSSTTQFIVDSVGNVGIGKSNPQTALDVVGNSYFRNAVGAVGSNDGVEIGTDSSAPRVSLVQGGRYVGLYSADAPGNTYLKNVAGGDLLLYGGSGGNQELARLTNSGFFGIGTSSPFVALAVQGSGYFTSGLTAATGTFTSATTTNFFSTNASTTNATSTNLYATNGSFGSLSVGASNSSGLATFGNGFLSLASSTIGNGTQAGGLTVSGGATTTGDSYIAGNLLVAGNTTTLGTSTSNLLVVNSAINSNLIPNGNKIFDLGSPSYYWRNGYIDTITVNNISAASTSIGGTASNTFTLNSDNATADTEDMSLIFFRGTVVPNALLSWNSAAGAKRFEFNQPLYISNQSGSTTQTTLTLKAVAGQTGNMLDIQNSSGSSLFSIGATGATTIGGSLTVQGSLTSTLQASTTLFSSLGPAYFGTTATTTIDTTGAITVTSGTKSTFPYASSTAVTVSGQANLGSLAGAAVSSLSNNYVPKWNSASGIFGQSLIYDSGTQVGIGTNSNLNGAVTANGTFGVQSEGDIFRQYDSGDAAWYPIIARYNTANGTYPASTYIFGNGTNARVGFEVPGGGNLTTFQVKSSTSWFNGNVGIGTTSPSTNLAVQGNGLFSGNVSLANLTATGTITTANLAATGLLSLANASTSQLSVFQKAYFGGTATTTIDSAGNISLPSGAQILAADGTGSLPGIAFANNPASGISNSAGSLSLSTDGFNRLTVTTGGVVGIGTTTPGANLEIASSLNGFTSNLLYLTNQGGATSTASRMTFRTLDQTGAATSTGAITSILNQNYGAGKGDLVFSTLQNGTLAEAMRVTSAGYVGIGTTTPALPLDVVGNAQLEGTNATLKLDPYGSGTGYSLVSVNNGRALFGYDGGNSNALVQAGSGKGIEFNVNSNTTGSGQAAVITSSGNFGIGTTTPSTNLSVQGNGLFSGNLSLANLTATGTITTANLTSTGLLSLANASTSLLSVFQRAYFGGTATSTFDNAGNLSLVSNGLTVGTNQLVASSGSVGIGTTTPNTALTVAASGLNGLNLDADTSDNTSSSRLFLSTGTSNQSIVFRNFGGTFSIATGGTVGSSAGSTQFLLTNSSATFTNYLNIAGTSGTTTIASGQGFTIGGSQFVLQQGSGRVGIGTTSPASLLSVAGNGYVTGGLGVGAVNSTAGTVYVQGTANTLLTLRNTNSTTATGFNFGDSSGTSGLYGSNGDSWFTTGGATALSSSLLTIKSSGNVGIGTTSPSFKFEVDSGSEWPIATRFASNSNTNRGLILSQRAAGSLAAPTAVQSGYILGGIDMAGYDGTSWTGGWNGGAEIYALASENWTSSAHGSDLAFVTTASGGTASGERMRITQAGSIGIGTTSPVNKLNVESQTASTFIGVESPLASQAGISFRDNTNGVDWLLYKFDGAGQTRDLNLWNPTNGSVMTFTNGAKVGVGTTSPFAKLAVTGAVSGTSFQVANSSNAPQFSVLSNGTVGIGTTTSSSATALTGLLNIQAVDTGTNPFSIFSETGASIFQFENSSGGRLYVKNTTGSTGVQLSGSTGGISYFNTGNVGVGTTTPFRKLSVTDTVSAAQVAIAYDGTRYTQEQTDASGDFHVNASGQDTLLDDSNMWVCSGGACPTGNPTGTGNLIVENKIGVGTSSPAYALDIVGSGNASEAHFGNVADGGAYILSANASQGLVSTGAAYNGTNWVAKSTTATIFGGSSGLLTFYSDSALTAGNTYTPTERMRIDTSGNVGIGTTSPSKQLSVQSTMYVGANGATGLGTATSTFQGDIKITGKLDVSTIDPPYTIDGTKYATYAASMTGVKEETAQTIELTQKDATGKYAYTINFDDQEKGSDLWLFYQVTDFGSDWQHLTVLLTPSFDGAVFYKKVPGEHKLIVYANQPGEVSMRLTGNRYDFTKWGNVRPDQDGNTEGTHVITSKPTIEQTAAAAVTQ